MMATCQPTYPRHLDYNAIHSTRPRRRILQPSTSSSKYVLVSCVLFFVVVITARLSAKSASERNWDVDERNVQFRTQSRSQEHAFYNYTQARAQTGACKQPNIHCGAILHVEKGPSAKVVYAGYIIYTLDTRLVNVSRQTAASVRATTLEQAIYFAGEVVDQLVLNYGSQFACGVRKSDVAQAIFHATSVVAECQNSSDPRCYDDYMVSSC